jgi:tetratricopeptide (TPR) repeat protein
MAYNNRGIASLCSGDTEAAIADLCRAIALDPAYRDAYHNRGLAYAEVGKLDEAIADLTHAIALDPTFWSAYRHRGIVHAMQGDHKASFQDYLKTRELAGDQ